MSRRRKEEAYLKNKASFLDLVVLGAMGNFLLQMTKFFKKTTAIV
jgi:hypothetical protein